MKFVLMHLCMLGVNLFIGCNSNPQSDLIQTDSIHVEVDTIQGVSQIKTETPKMKYSIFIMNDSLRKQFRKGHTKAQLERIAALNRIDGNKLLYLDSIVVMDSLNEDWLIYSPFPDSIPLVADINKIILISYPIQAFSFYVKGKLVNWGPVSMGKKSTPTPIGFFHTNWKSKLQISTENPEWLLPWYFNIVNASGVSLHQFQLPGYPASHACIRMREQDAYWIYIHADQWKLDKSERQILFEGTPLFIYGNYAFGKARPWYALVKDSKANCQDLNTLNRLITPYLSTLIKEQKMKEISIQQ
jgi:hypothetical protein